MSRIIAMFVMMVLFAQVSFAAGLLVSADAANAKVQIYNEDTKVWSTPSPAPYYLPVDQYTYVAFKVTAPGFKEYEQGVDVRCEGTLHINAPMEPVDGEIRQLALYAFGGYVKAKSGRTILPNQYQVYVRNMSTHVTGVDQGQKTQDQNPNDSVGWYSLTLADFGTNRAVATGDRLFIGVYNYNKSRCYGYVYHVITDADMRNGGYIADITIK